jgi:CheY-like chemotaxis protein
VLFVLADPAETERIRAHFEKRHHYNAYQFYRVLTATSGRAAIEICEPETLKRIDIIVLDMDLPDMSGYQVIADMYDRLPPTYALKLVFLVSQDVIAEKVQMLGSDILYHDPPSVSDQMIRPPQRPGCRTWAKRLKLRKEMPAKSYDRISYIQQPLKLEGFEQVVRRLVGLVEYNHSPTTHLPSGKAIQYYLEKLIDQHGWTMLYTKAGSIEQLWKGADRELADDLVRFLADIIEDAVERYGTPRDFIGHISSGEFVLVCWGEDIDIIRQNIRTHFAEGVQARYPERIAQVPEHLPMAVLKASDGPFANIRDLIDRVSSLVLSQGETA